MPLNFDLNPERGEFVRPVFMSFTYGTHRTRILGQPLKKWTHFFSGRGTVECLGRDCPICQNNKQIRLNYPDDFRRQKGYNGSSGRHYLNILDRTPVKTCPSCETENKAMPSGEFISACENCGVFITDVEPTPSDKIKVINISETNATMLRMFQSKYRDKEGNEIGLENFDIIWEVVQVNKQKNIIPQVDETANDKIEVPEDELYDLERAGTVKLTAEEIVDFVGGVNLKDIFSARNVESDATVVDEQLEKDVEERLEEMFTN